MSNVGISRLQPSDKVSAYIILLGISDVGKSSLMRQLKAIYEKSNNNVLFRSYCKDMVWNNVIGITSRLVHLCNPISRQQENFEILTHKLEKSDRSMLLREIFNMSKEATDLMREAGDAVGASPGTRLLVNMYNTSQRPQIFEKVTKMFENPEIRLIADMATLAIASTDAQQYILKYISEFKPFPDEKIPYVWNILFPGYPSLETYPQIPIPLENDTFLVCQDFRGPQWKETSKNGIDVGAFPGKTVVFVVDLLEYKTKFSDSLDLYQRCLQGCPKLWQKTDRVHFVFTKTDLFRIRLQTCPLRDFYHDALPGGEFECISKLFETITPQFYKFGSYFVNSLDILDVGKCFTTILRRHGLKIPISEKYINNPGFYRHGLYNKIDPIRPFGLKILEMPSWDVTFQ